MQLKESVKIERRLMFVTILSFSLMIIELTGGYISNSAAVITDGVEKFSDVCSLLISITSTRMTRTPAQLNKTFGYHRAEVLGAISSCFLIWIIIIWLCILASVRVHSLLYGEGFLLNAKIMLITAIISFIVNMMNLTILGMFSGDGYGLADNVQSISNDSEHHNEHEQEQEHQQETQNLNFKTIAYHAIGDLLQSMGVIIAATIIYYYPQCKILDPICTYIFSLIIFIASVPVF